jgi:hypothetical protein
MEARQQDHRRLTTSPGWRTSVFLLQRQGRGERVGKSPDLAGSAISMSKMHSNFSPANLETKMVETARLAVMNRRPVLRGELHDMLNGKFGNPILGILGAHLLLMSAERDQALLEIVIDNLRKILGAPHPEVEAIALAAGLGSSYDFAVPPMLRRSWMTVLEHSVSAPRSAASGTLSSQIGTKITQQDPWLIWKKPTRRTAEDYLKGAPSALLREMAIPREADNLNIESDEHGNAGLAKRGADFISKYISFGHSAVDDRREAWFAHWQKEENMRRLVLELGIPRSNVEQLLKASYERLSKESLEDAEE